MFCNKCGNELNKDDLFCSKCGANVDYNQACGKENRNNIENDTLVTAIRQFKRGNKDSFSIIYAETFKYVYRRAKYLLKNEDEAQDLTQDVYLALYQRLESLKDDNSVFGWLKTVVFRQGLKYIEKNKNILLTEADSEYIFEDIADEYVRVEDDYGHSEDAATVKRCLDFLSEEQRLVVLAYYYDNMSVKEIADVFEISEGTVKSRLYLARKRLMVILDEEEEKQGYKFFAAGIPALTMALDDIMTSEVKITRDAVIAHYQETCSELGIEPEVCLPEQGQSIDNIFNADEMLTDTAGIGEKAGVFGKLAGLGAKKIALTVAGVLVAGGIVGGAVIMSDDKNVEAPEQAPTKVAEEISEKETVKDPAEDKELVDELYGDYLQAYRNYQESGFTEEPEVMISLMYSEPVYFPDGCDMELYYAVVDVVDDGLPELFISDKQEIFDTVMPMSDEIPEHVYVVETDSAYLGDRVHCQICDNGYIRVDRGGGLNNTVEYFKLEDKSSDIADGYGAEMDGETYYALEYSQETYSFVRTKEITEKEYHKISENYNVKSDIKWHKLSEYVSEREKIEDCVEFLEQCELAYYGVEKDETQPIYAALYETEAAAYGETDEPISKLVEEEKVEEYPNLYRDGAWCSYYVVKNFKSINDVIENAKKYLSDNLVSELVEPNVDDFFVMYEGVLYFANEIPNNTWYDIYSIEYLEDDEKDKKYVTVEVNIFDMYDHTEKIELVKVGDSWVIEDVSEYIIIHNEQEALDWFAENKVIEEGCSIMADGYEDGIYYIRYYEDYDDHITTLAWYEVYESGRIVKQEY